MFAEIHSVGKKMPSNIEQISEGVADKKLFEHLTPESNQYELPTNHIEQPCLAKPPEGPQRPEVITIALEALRPIQASWGENSNPTTSWISLPTQTTSKVLFDVIFFLGANIKFSWPFGANKVTLVLLDSTEEKTTKKMDKPPKESDTFSTILVRYSFPFRFLCP